MNIENIQINVLDKVVELLRIHGHDVAVNFDKGTLENFGIIGDVPQ